MREGLMNKNKPAQRRRARGPQVHRRYELDGTVTCPCCRRVVDAVVDTSVKATKLRKRHRMVGRHLIASNRGWCPGSTCPVDSDGRPMPPVDTVVTHEVDE